MWFGWCFHHGRWHRVCEGQTMQECARALSVKADKLGVPDKHCVMTSGQMPSFLPKLPARRRRSDERAER
jgi:hypothetical protein